MSKFFINRPIVAIVISILMVLVGVVCDAQPADAQFPNIADPMIQVKATYPGADAQTIAESVATPIEQQMSGVSGMNYMYSLSASQRRKHDAVCRLPAGNGCKYRSDSGADAQRPS